MNQIELSQNETHAISELESKKMKMLDPNLLKAIKHDLVNKGFHFIHGFFSPEFCQEVMNFIDSYQYVETEKKGFNVNEKNYGGSELRIWNSEEKSPVISEFKTFSDEVYSKMLNKPMDAFNILSIRNSEINEEDAKLKKGRWHIDSFNTQYKLFLFLTKTTQESGPFEFVPGTHKKGFKYSMLLKGKYIDPLDFIKGSRKYRSIPDEEIEGKYESIPALCDAGTLMFIDTSALHRARPCIKGKRYALTSYYR